MKQMRRVFAFFILVALSTPHAWTQNNSVFFDGSSMRIRNTENQLINPAAMFSALKISGTAITVEAWVYPVGFPNPGYGNPIVTRPYGTALPENVSYGLSVYNGNGFAQASFTIASGSAGTRLTVLAPDTLQTFRWTHLAGVYDGATLSIYENGILQAQVSGAISINSTSGNGFNIGRFSNDSFEGTIDEVRLWNITRTQTDIQNAMNAQLVGNESGLAGYWNLDAVAIVSGKPVVQDQTSNHNDLAIAPATVAAFNPWTVYGVPTFTFGPSPIDLGTLEQGTIVNKIITITNTGADPLLGVFQPWTPALRIVGSTGFFVAPGKTANINLASQLLEAGSTTSGLIILSNAASSVQIPVSYTSIALRRFDANNIGMWTLRNGIFAYNPMTGAAGLEWPIGSAKTAVYSSGIWIGATVSGTTRTATAFYRTEFSPGPVINGVAANPSDTTYRVYSIRAGDNAATNSDFATWPSNLGAPVNPDGTPKVIGDQTLFCVYNDLNPTLHFLGTQPLGAEVQQTVFGFNRPDARANTVFLVFKIINRSNTTWNNTYVSLWSDPDLGNAGDDLIGIDTTRSLGFVYNGSDADAVYGIAPPSLGYQILKGAFFTKPIQAFAYFTGGGLPFPRFDPQTGQQAYYFMQGLWADGTPFINPLTSQPSLFPLSGDPVAVAGWVDAVPADRRFLFSTGPFNLDPGQSKEMVAAIVVGQGSSNLNSITVLRTAADSIKSLYDGGRIFGGAVQNITSTTTAADSTTILDDLSHSGAQLTVTGGAGGATVEAATYVQPPAGVEEITTPSVSGVGKYLDIQVQGTVTWPVIIKMYYTANDLAQAGVFEDDLLGIFYWSGTSNTWNLYSNSGADDQGRGPSTTTLNTTNVTINNVAYEGYVEATAYHLTPVTIGAKRNTIADRYTHLLQYVRALPDRVFKRPAKHRRLELEKKIEESQKKFSKGDTVAAAKKLREDVLEHLIPHGKHDDDVWIKDNAARTSLVQMIEDLLAVLKRAPKLKHDKHESSQSDNGGGTILPTVFALGQNFPNPFNPTTEISYQLPKPARVTLKIYNLLGEVVATLVNDQQSAGFYRAAWNARTATGVYIYRLEAISVDGSFDRFIDTKKMLLVK